MKKNNLIAVIILLPLLFNGQIINVPNDQPNIQAGINAAMDGDTVLVEDSTYYENIRFMGKAITVASRFLLDGNEDHIDNTIIDGSMASNPDSASTVMFINSEDTTSILCGFTITGGSGVNNTIWQVRYGGGIFCWNAGANIIYNKIIENTVTDPSINCGGAGIGGGMNTGNYWIVINNNIISNNLSIANAEFSFGGGIHISSNAIIKNNTIELNNCYNSGTFADGGGIEIEQISGLTIEASIFNNVVRNNTLEAERALGGGINIYYASVAISNNVIENNENITDRSWGVGLLCIAPTGKVNISNNHFLGNIGPLYSTISAGGGACIRDAIDTEIIVDGNIFENNETKHGGGFYERSSYNVLLTNNVFKENSTFMGGGIGLYHPSSGIDYSKKGSKENRPKIINNTFYANTAIDHAGAFRFNGIINNPVILNSIFWENDAPNGKDILNYNSTDLHISYCNINTDLISGTWSGDYNILVDPQFIDDLCHIDFTSLCIEAGITSYEAYGDTYNCPDFDMDGQIRPLNGTADIGADEVLITGIRDPFTNHNTHSLDVYPNPLSTEASIEFTLLKTGYVSLSVFDITGKQMETIISAELQKGDHQLPLNMAKFQSGIYYIILKTNDPKLSEQTRKIIKL